MTHDEIEALAERLDHAYYIVTRPNLGWPRRSVSIAVDDCGGAVTALRALVAERDELQRQATDILLEQVGVEAFTATAEGMIGRLRGGPLALIMAEAFGRDLGEAPNYVECQLATKAGQFITVTIQRHPGQTPHQMREAAERERDALTAQVRELRVDKERLDWIQGQVVDPTGHIGDVTVYGNFGPFVTVAVGSPQDVGHERGTGGDLRAALDAARAGENTT